MLKEPHWGQRKRFCYLVISLFLWNRFHKNRRNRLYFRRLYPVSPTENVHYTRFRRGSAQRPPSEGLPGRADVIWGPKSSPRAHPGHLGPLLKGVRVRCVCGNRFESQRNNGNTLGIKSGTGGTREKNGVFRGRMTGEEVTRVRNFDKKFIKIAKSKAGIDGVKI